jgi:hypothetical protein
MSASTTARWLSEAISQATRSSKFCVAGCLSAIDPGIAVDGLGAIRLPLKRAKAKELTARCQVAPYGKGTQTLVDRNVRNTFELDPKEFRLSQEWSAAVAGATQHAAQQLGLPAERVEARLYKLLVYERGGFFLPHRDSEKHDGMVASMIVVLANPFEGGQLIVRHGAVRQTLPFKEAAQGKAPCYAAFYADCEHEVQRVTGGVRLCLAYNLVLKRAQPSAAGKPAAAADALTASIASWVATQPAEPLVFALEHHYTERGLALDLLKGADRQLAELVVPAAEKADCLVHLAQVSRHLLQFADDGSFERDYYRNYRPRRQIEIGETYEDELTAAEWTAMDGKKQPWGPIPLELSAIVCSLPIDEWKPTSEDFEGYTGNAGNTLDRWYHRSAIVLWHRDHHFDVVASCGAAVSIPLFRALAAKLAKTPKKRLEAARTDCICFARAIIARWPAEHFGYGHRATGATSPYGDFPDLVLTLGDRDTIAQLLSKLAVQDQTLRLAPFVVAACREFGWNAFARELKQLIAPRPDEPARQAMRPRQRQEIPLRDLEWLAAFCVDRTADPDKSALANELCELAVERFCVPPPPRPAYSWAGARREPSVAETSLPWLLKALLASGRDQDLSRVIQFVESLPNEFTLDDCQVPSIQSLVPWSQKHLGLVHPQLLSWLASVRQKLEAVTATQPAPPGNWARPAEVACSCQYCAQLNAFLADAANEVGRIPAREDMRQHLIGMIGQHDCDVKHALEQKGSPYSLVLTKTTGSFDRATKRFEANCRLLKILDDVSKGIAVQKSKAPPKARR